MKSPLTIYRQGKVKEEKQEKTKNPWLLQTVENGLKATNIKELPSRVKPNKKINPQYFEYDRIFGQGAFSAPLKVLEMFDELRDITPETTGFVFGAHKYIYLDQGILRKNHKTKKESFFSERTLLNESVACYLNLVYSQEEDLLLELIKELDNATTTKSSQENNDRRRIQG